MWFKAEYTDTEGNKIKKRSNEEKYEDIFESIDDDYAPLNAFLDYGASYKEWIKKTYEKGGIDLLMGELEKYDYLTEQDEGMNIPFSVCDQFIEQFKGDELISSNISLIEFPNCWKICQKGYDSNLYLYEGMQSDDITKINRSETNPGEYLRRLVEATLEGIFWEAFERDFDSSGEEFIFSTSLMDTDESEEVDFEKYIGIQEPIFKFPNFFKKESFNRIIEALEDEDYIEDSVKKKYLKKLKEQIDLLK